MRRAERTLRLEHRRGFREAGRLDVGHDQPGALLRKLQRIGTAETARGAGHQYDFVR